MDMEDESTGYLKLFSEGTHNYLLHNSEDSIDDTFPVEPIFTEIPSEWSTEGLPILLSGPLISDENNDENVNTNVQILRGDNENNVNAKDSAVTFLPNGDKNSLIFSNDVFLRLEENQENTVTHVINGDSYSIAYAQNSQEVPEQNVELIQLLDIDGSVTHINKNLLNTVGGKERVVNYEEFYTPVQAYKCKMCSFLCESSEDIVTHIKVKHDKEIHKNNGVINNELKEDLNGTKMTSILNTNLKKKYILYLCSDCGSGYSNKEDLRQHMISQHKAVEISASTATDKTSDKSKTTEIEQKRSDRAMSVSLLKKQKAVRAVKCSIKGCPLRFEKDECRKKHEECHVDQNKKQFMCPICKAKFSIWRVCSMHLWKNHSIDLGLFTCPMCNEFKSYSSIRIVNHMAIHSEERPFVCTSCGKKFKQLNQLKYHEIIHKDPNEVPSSFKEKQCEFCDRYFANSKSLKKHIKFVHDKFKPFICNICGHQTARKEMLQLHHRQHTGDKPFQCSYCEYKTGDRNCLRKHTMRHFGAAKYSCPYCSYQSIQTSAYKAHLASKHPGKEGTYSCTLCRYTTINCRSYLAHVKCHELEKTKKTNNKIEKRNVEDNESKSSDETQNFLNTEHSEEAVDTGGITIPAGFDLQINNEQTCLM